MRRRVATIAVSTVAVVGGLTSPATAHEEPGPSGPVVVVSGLNNPRQLSMVDESLLVAEAGRGGPTCSSGGPEGNICVGTTGSVTRIRKPDRVTNGAPQRIVTGLLSGAQPDGTFAIGSDGVSARDEDKIFIAMTYAPPDVIPAPLPGWQAGKLLRADERGRVRQAADITAVELTLDPDKLGIDSNPYAVLALDGRQLVADAGGNDIIQVKNGRTSVWAVLPNHDGAQPVPTSLARGRDGSIYVGELALNAGPGKALVHRYAANGTHLGTIGGFTTITGLAFDKAGNLYVSQLFADSGTPGPPGVLTRVDRAGQRTNVAVPFPAGVATDERGNVYVSAWSISDADGATMTMPPEMGGGTMTMPPGQVWRLRF